MSNGVSSAVAMESSTVTTRLKEAEQTLLASPRWQIVNQIRSQGDGDNEEDHDVGIATATSKPELKRPPMYKVILLNDDYTPMEFVVHILEKFFAMDREKATQIMLTVHTQGAATVGIFPRDIAESKSEQVNIYAQENNHPLMSTVEMTDTE